jgi:signal transduction histidine kinase
MPDIDGFATCRAIRALPGGRTMPILMATGHDDLASIEASYAAGATDFVSKPVNWGLLPHRIRYLLRSDEILRNLMLSERWLAEAQRIAAVGNFIWSPPSGKARLSAEAARIFGYAGDPGAVPLRSLLRRILACDRRQVIGMLRQIEQRRVIEVDHRILLAGGETRHISLRAECGSAANGQKCVQGTCHDITDRKKIEMELRLARDEAEGADAAKTAFLATMSHELQTPLNAIIGFSELLARQAADAPPNDKSLVFSTCILDAGRRMYAAIDEVLTMARLEAGAYQPETAVLDLCELVRAIVAEFRRGADASGRAILVETALASAVVPVDERAIRRMLGNLLSNAVKFSPADTPVTVSVDDATDGHYRLTVEDYGIGMSAAEAARAVRAFRQLDERLAREFSGMGLGLSIAKGLIEAHGGNLEIASAPGKGTRVVLNFPLPGRDWQEVKLPAFTVAA